MFFTSNDVAFEPADPERLIQWILNTVEAEGYELNRLDIVFCSDEFLLEINRNHLDHDYYTDIITFPLNDNPLIAEIYISIDRVQENAAGLNISFEDELHRVMIHGVLHLCGYDDHEEEDIRMIRKKEEFYLKQLAVSSEQ
ncbi:MAG: rRNA maturation RNase YbeY [Saprospiraceae bacterium]|nr:rRNA maturation RNase YbeY [Candidatus Opimibacter skivensis]MBL0007436.1 rRNA maturation RNase YbeY [Candidatus Opimibacter skivensis]